MEDIRAETAGRYGGEWQIKSSAPIGGPKAAFAGVQLNGHRPGQPKRVLTVEVFRRPPDLLLCAYVGKVSGNERWPVTDLSGTVIVPTDDPDNITPRFVRAQSPAFLGLVAETEAAP
jgi:hypothetical protein